MSDNIYYVNLYIQITVIPFYHTLLSFHKVNLFRDNYVENPIRYKDNLLEFSIGSEFLN